MEGDFYKCEEVAFSQGISSSAAMAVLIAQATSACQMWFFLSGGQPALPVINPDIHDTDIYYMMILSLCQRERLEIDIIYFLSYCSENTINA